MVGSGIWGRRLQEIGTDAGPACPPRTKQPNLRYVKGGVCKRGCPVLPAKLYESVAALDSVRIHGSLDPDSFSALHHQKSGLSSFQWVRARWYSMERRACMGIIQAHTGLQPTPQAAADIAGSVGRLLRAVRKGRDWHGKQKGVAVVTNGKSTYDKSNGVAGCEPLRL